MRNKPVSVFPLLTALIAAIWAIDAEAVDHLDIAFDRDSSLLPYSIEVFHPTRPSFESRKVNHPIRVFQSAKALSDSAIVLVADNASPGSDLPSMVELSRYPEWVPLKEHPTPLTVTDAGIYHTRNSSQPQIWFAGYLRDSAWIHFWNPATDQRDSVLLATNEDPTKDNMWECELNEVASFDSDYDGKEEHMFYLKPKGSHQTRRLFCVKPESHRIEWSVPMASTIPFGCVVPCGDSTDPCVLVCSYGPGQGCSDSVFSDNYGYLSQIDRHGKIVFNKVISRYSEGTALLPCSDHSGYYLLHSLPFLDTCPSEGPPGRPSTISILDRSGNVVHSTIMPERIAFIWLADYNGGGKSELYTLSFNHVVRILSADLTPLAESNTTNLEYRGQLLDWVGRGPVLFFNEGIRTGVYTPRFEKLAVGPEHQYRDVISTDDLGHVTAFLGADQNSHFVGRIKSKSFWDMLTILYVDNQKWVLAILSSLLVGLVVVNYYRGRITKQKHELEAAHKELAQTHEALKQAQETIIAQEKYRQAKDIAGGFAHEIRNALFPADSSLTKLRTLGDLSQAKAEKITALHETIRTAVLKAIDITKQISRYTKLESEYHPEPVNLQHVVEEVLHANRLRIDDCGVTVRTKGDPDVSVSANATQLYSVFNNLLLNSLDALTNRTNPAILIGWSIAQGLVSISFSDNGIGISDQDQKRIFDTFFSTKPNTGTGLGLAVAKRIVEMYAGSIAVSSMIGEGTRFDIRMKQAQQG